MTPAPAAAKAVPLIVAAAGGAWAANAFHLAEALIAAAAMVATPLAPAVYKDWRNSRRDRRHTRRARRGGTELDDLRRERDSLKDGYDRRGTETRAVREENAALRKEIDVLRQSRHDLVNDLQIERGITAQLRTELERLRGETAGKDGHRRRP